MKSSELKKNALLCGECLGIKAEKAFRFIMGDLVANERQEH